MDGEGFDMGCYEGVMIEMCFQCNGGFFIL